MNATHLKIGRKLCRKSSCVGNGSMMHSIGMVRRDTKENEQGDDTGRTSDRAGRVRAPTHAHPVFDDKISTPTRPARAKKRNGRPPNHWASASATRPPTRPKGKRLKVVVGARSPRGKHPVAWTHVGFEPWTHDPQQSWLPLNHYHI